MRLFICSITLTLILSCNPYEVHKISGIDLSTIQADTTFRLRSDGLYNTIDVEAEAFKKLKPYRPLIVLNTQKSIFMNEINFNDIALRLEFYTKFLRFMDDVGDYVIRNDTIWAKIPISLNARGMTPEIYETYFQGEIKNQDTIVNWRMIRPFPKANKNWNEESFEVLTKPHQLHFIESKELLGLDSLYRQRLKEKEEMLKEKGKRK